MRRTRIGGIARICVRFAVDLRPNCGCFRPICGCLRTFFARFAFVCRRGVAPIDDVLPLQGAIPFKPSRGGDPGCRSLRSLYPGLRYHCLRRSQAAPQHSSCKQACLALHSVCTDIALTGRHGFKTIDLEYIICVPIGCRSFKTFE